MQPSPQRTADDSLGSRTGGVTLVEVLIVVVLIGILGSITIPTYLKDRPAADVRDAAAELANVLQNARFRAVSLKRPVYVEFEPDGEEGFYTAYVDLDSDPSTVPTGTASEIAATDIPFPDQASGQRGNRLPEGVEFDLGGSTSSPDEEASTPTDPIDLPSNPIVFLPRGVVRWPAGSTIPSGGVYVSHRQNGSYVNSVLIRPTGLIRNYQWTGGGWR